MPQRSSRWLAAALAAAYAVAATAIGLTLILATDDRGTPFAVPLRPPPVIVTTTGPAPVPVPPPVTTTAAPPSTPPGTTQPGTPAPPTGTTTASPYRPVTGPKGLTTVLPTGWPVRECGKTCLQATHPGDPDRWVRIGADPPTKGPLLAGRQAYAPQYAKTHGGYEEIRLEARTHNGHDAVDWEFEYDGDKGRRHSRILYWRANDVEYHVYTSSQQAQWPAVQPVHDSIVARTTP